MQKRVIIVGAGSAGISVAARLRKALRNEEIVIIDPADKHYYQPLWTLVGAGVFDVSESVRDESSLIPSGVQWVKERVVRIDPETNTVETDSGKQLTYTVLVVCPGLQLNWDQVKGLPEAIGHDGVCSNYSADYVSYTWECIRSFKGGTALFTHPNTVVKCGGAPQKIAYLADDYFRISGVRDKTNLIFASAQPAIFHVPHYARTLEQVVQRKGIETRFRNSLIEIKGQSKEAIFENLDTGEKSTIKYDMAHVSPPMGPPNFIKSSPLADVNGWVDTNKNTLQHVKYSNIFALGDCANLPTSKTGAAIRKQAPVVVTNVMATLFNFAPTAEYDGYTSCPLVTGYKSLILAEFDYELNPKESFPFDQNKERYSMYLLKKYLLPKFYWDGMLKGRM